MSDFRDPSTSLTLTQAQLKLWAEPHLPSVKKKSKGVPYGPCNLAFSSGTLAWRAYCHHTHQMSEICVFICYHRHELFDDVFQEELAALCAPSLRGLPPLPPARLALATILQAYTSLIKGVAKDQRISIKDGQMRHRHKSRSVLIGGYKRHLLQDLDPGFIRAVGITPANVPEASVTEAISEDLAQ